MKRLVFVALVLALAGCGGDGARISVRSLPRLVLQRQDVLGSAQVELGRIGIADTQAGAREDLHRFGRKGGWIARYRGAFAVTSTADLFGSESGAKQDFDAYDVQFQEEIVDSDGMERFVHVPRIGAASLAVTIASGGVRTSTIAWRNANATASVQLSGPDRVVTVRSLVALARRQERHIEAALVKHS